MTFVYSPAQITLAKKLVKWARTKMPESMARREIAGIIKSHSVKDIEWACTQSNCTSVDSMKKILKAKAA